MDYDGLDICSHFGRFGGLHAGVLGQNDTLVPLPCVSYAKV